MVSGQAGFKARLLAVLRWLSSLCGRMFTADVNEDSLEAAKSPKSRVTVWRKGEAEAVGLPAGTRWVFTGDGKLYEFMPDPEMERAKSKAKAEKKAKLKAQGFFVNSG